ncbi:MAG TPA: methyltransferase domain-containing protein [Lacipirellula sp.]
MASLTRVIRRFGGRIDARRVAMERDAERRAVEQALARFAAPYRFHFACGTVKLPGWVNIDRDPVSEIVDISWDIRQPLPVADGCVELIHHEHFLEHLDVGEGVAFLRQCHRLLMPGGVLRVAMPDMAECVRQYYENDWRQPWMKKYGYEWIQTRAELLNICFRDWEHKWLYDREELHRRLREAGFVKIRDCERRESTVEGLRGLETRDESLLVCEAVR